MYIKFWRQACLPSLLCGTELFTLTPPLLAKFERCQQWFLKNVFYVRKFASKQLLLKLSGLKSIESEIALRRLLFLGRLLSGDKISQVVRELFEIRADSYFDTNIDSWYHDSSLQTYASSKTAVKCKIWELEENSWNSFVFDHPNLSLCSSCLPAYVLVHFWSIPWPSLPSSCSD